MTSSASSPTFYSGALTEFVTLYRHILLVVGRRGTLRGNLLPPLLFDIMVEPLIRRLTAADKGFNITSCGLKPTSKWYSDDGILVTNSVEDVVSLMDIVQKFSSWFGIHLNVDKCKIAAYIHAFQTIPRKNDRDDALRARLARVTLSGHASIFLTQDQPLPGGYLGTSLMASLSPEAHLH